MYLVEHRDTRGVLCRSLEDAITELHFFGYDTPKDKKKLIKALEKNKYWENEEGASITQLPPETNEEEFWRF
jgi:hypothetical protein